MDDWPATEHLAYEMGRLRADAGNPSYAVIEGWGRRQSPEVNLGKSKLSPWFSGKSVPADGRPFTILIELLEDRASRKSGTPKRGVQVWRAMRSDADQERRRVGRGSSQGTLAAPPASSAGQFDSVAGGSIGGDANVTAAAESPETLVRGEELADQLRRSSGIWRARLSSVDFVNLPRMPMLSAGDAVLVAAKRAGLDGGRPFRDQGMAAGEFVRIVRPLFEMWDAETVVLSSRTVGMVRRGMLVSFEEAMRCRNPPPVPLQAPSGVVERDPHLVFRAGELRVVVSFDPRWLTTSTANTTLHDAARNAQIFSGLGQVAAVTESGQVRVSALIFGQPQTHVQAQFEHAQLSTLPSPRGLTGADFRNELSMQEGGPLYGTRPRKEEVVQSMSVVLFFDEEEVLPGQIDRDVLKQITRIVPEYRRDLSLAVARLVPKRGTNPADLAAHLIARDPALWKTFTVPGLTTLIRSRSLAVSTVAGISLEQATDLDEVMRAEIPSYLGGLELDWNLPMHRQMFPSRDKYHVVGGELCLRYSAGDRALAEANDEDLDEPLEEWRQEGLFRSVVWEEDVAQSAADERYASTVMQAWLADQRE